jgi:hypothetical protein
MAISLLFLAILEQHRGGENQGYVDTHDTEGTSKDKIEKAVTERGKGSDTANLLCCCCGVGACGIDGEGRRGAICVAAAVELFWSACFVRTEAEGGTPFVESDFV